jgi:hypothetical protein
MWGGEPCMHPLLLLVVVLLVLPKE